MAQTDSCSFKSNANVRVESCSAHSTDHQLAHHTCYWCYTVFNWEKMWSLVIEHHTNSMQYQVYESKPTKWTISDSISQATLSWKEVLLFLQHLIRMCSSVLHTSLQMPVDQVECKNLKCSKCHTIVRSLSLSTSAVFFSLHSPSSVILVWISVLSFLTGAIHWMNSRSTKVRVKKREAERKEGRIQKKKKPPALNRK